jgi:hypothetical protein
MEGMNGEHPLTDIELRLLGVLGARGGRSSPGGLREATGVSARTLTRALGRLDEAGLLAKRSKRVVRLSAAAWQLLDRPQVATRQVQRPVFRARVEDRPSSAPTLRSEPSEPDEPTERGPSVTAHDDRSGDLFTGLVEGFSRPV